MQNNVVEFVKVAQANYSDMVKLQQEINDLFNDYNNFRSAWRQSRYSSIVVDDGKRSEHIKFLIAEIIKVKEKTENINSEINKNYTNFYLNIKNNLKKQNIKSKLYDRLVLTIMAIYSRHMRTTYRQMLKETKKAISTLDKMKTKMNSFVKNPTDKNWSKITRNRLDKGALHEYFVIKPSIRLFMMENKKDTKKYNKEILKLDSNVDIALESLKSNVDVMDEKYRLAIETAQVYLKNLS